MRYLAVVEVEFADMANFEIDAAEALVEWVRTARDDVSVDVFDRLKGLRYRVRVEPDGKGYVE